MKRKIVSPGSGWPIAVTKSPGEPRSSIAETKLSQRART